MKRCVFAVAVAIAMGGCDGDEANRASGPLPSALTSERPARTPDVGGTSDAAQTEPRGEDTEPQATEGDHRFMLAMDDYAIEADDLIDRALDGEVVADELERVRARITKRNNARLLAGEDTWPGVEPLRSAIATATSAARARDLPRLVRARADILEARGAISDG